MSPSGAGGQPTGHLSALFLKLVGESEIALGKEVELN